ncbi:MAG: polysaccharide deacetylase [Ruminococcaceae bacterium]|nr:polysaccharide deacetylase [Oscillospiraceae bacterium]
MQFGSVAFFKVLIKTVLCIVFFVPLVLCVIFAVLLWNKGVTLEEVQYENEKLAYKVELLSGNADLTVEDFYKVYSESGLSDAALIAYINGEAVPDDTQADVQTKEASSVVTEEVSAEAVQTAETAEPEQTEETQEVPVVEPVSPYASLYEDMTVRVPTVFVREEGTIYLTFDDGPSKNTYSVLYYLDKYDIKATFFVVPQRTEECYAIMKQIVDSGHAIGVHSTSHDYNTIYTSVEAYLEDFYNAWQMIYEATGVKTEIFRFPGGSLNDYNAATRDAIIEEMTRRGFRFYDWNVDSNDAGGATWTDMYNSIPAAIATKVRSFVLMHDSAARENTVYVLEDILMLLKNEGYKFDKINNNTQPVQFIGPYA